jgi:hypothetical protein
LGWCVVASRSFDRWVALDLLARCPLARCSPGDTQSRDALAQESAGAFCMCLTRREAADATPLSSHECQPPCASSLRLHANAPNMRPLPCGGSEAVALFATDRMLEALDKAATTKARQRATAAAKGKPKGSDERCAPMAEACAAAPARKGGVRALYVHAHAADTTRAPPYAAFLGCFDAIQLERAGLTHRPDSALVAATAHAAGGGPAADDAVARCSLGCAAYAHFGVGGEQLVGGGCLCGELRSFRWRRDEDGVRGLRQKALRSLT